MIELIIVRDNLVGKDDREEKMDFFNVVVEILEINTIKDVGLQQRIKKVEVLIVTKEINKAVKDSG